MTTNELALLSTLAWLIGTGVLFVALAGWSAGASWGLTASIVRGLHAWSDHQDADHPPAPTSPGASRTAPPAAPTAPRVVAEVEDLGTRRLRQD